MHTDALCGGLLFLLAKLANTIASRRQNDSRRSQDRGEMGVTGAQKTTCIAQAEYYSFGS